MTPTRDPPPSVPPRRISLLPPELDDIDAGWGEEPATVVPARAPSLLPREPSLTPRAPSVLPPGAARPDAARAPSLPPPPSHDPLISLLDDDPDNRVTSIPELPQDEFARRLMAESKSDPPRLLDAPQPLDDDLRFELDSESPFDRPTRDGVNQNAQPTTPPGGSEDDRFRTVPRVPRPQADTAPSRRAVTPVPRTPVTLPPNTRREPLAPNDRATRPERAQQPAPAALRPLHIDSEPPLSAVERARRAVTPQQRPVAKVTAAPDPSSEMRDRFAMGDFSGALDIAERILGQKPNDGEAATMAAKCREVLYDMYSSRIAGFERELQVIMGPDQLRWLSLDHRAGFLLAMIDRGTTVDELLDVSGMPRLDALRILCDLLDQKVVGLSR